MDNNASLINTLLPLKGINTYTKNILLILFGTILLAVSSKIQVPFWSNGRYVFGWTSR